MCLAQPWLLVLVAAVLRTQAAAAEAAVHDPSQCLDRQELTSALQVDVQVGHRAEAPTMAKEATPGDFEPRRVWFPLALFSANYSVETWVANTFVGGSDGMMNSTGDKQTEETSSGDASTGVVFFLLAVALMAVCGLAMMRNGRTDASFNDGLGSVSRGTASRRPAAAGTMSKGLLSRERSARASLGALPVLTTKTLPPLVKMRGTGSPAPSPRTLAQMPVPRDSVPGRQVLLTDPSAWVHIEAYFTIQALQLYDVADSEATGAIDIMRGGQWTPLDATSPSPQPHFVASVQPMDATPRALMIATADQRGRPLCSCAPAGVLSGASSSGFCSELEFRDSRGRPWGALVPRGPDTYTIFKQGGREALLVEGDQASGRLVVRLGDEVVAHAAMDNDCTMLEVGVKPHTDPILMLTSVLAVLIFNPEDPGYLSPERISM